MKTYKHYIIYQITNLVNGHIYIGKHRCNELDDNYFGSGKVLWLAILKYGIENFVFQMLIDLHNEEEMDLLEELVVNKDFLARDDVYNISRGGKNPCMYGKQNPFFGKTHSDEFKVKMSKVHKGKAISEEHKCKISNTLKKLYFDHPELCIRQATKLNKRQCKNKTTGKIQFFTLDSIPNDFEIYLKSAYQPVSKEKILQNRKKHSEYMRKKSSMSRWYTNGIEEKFCLAGQIPEGFIPGRLSTLNVGRKMSAETREKISKKHRGKTPSNKGKITITDGKTNKYIDKNAVIPDGWRRGLSRTKNRLAQ